MEEVLDACDTPPPNCVHKTVGSDSKLPGRKSRSAWKRTKRFLICSYCGGNESDSSDTCDGHMRTIVDVPLCSGDKNTDPTAKMIRAVVENVEDGNLVSLSDDHFSEVELDRINPEEIFQTVMDKYSPSCANVTKSVSDFKAVATTAVEEGESGEIIEKINATIIQKKQCLEIVGKIHESDHVEKEGNVQDAFQEVSDQEALVDVTEYDPDEFPEVNAFHNEPVVGKGPESVTEGEGEERSDLPAQADGEIKEETKKEAKEAVQLEPVYEKKDVPQEDHCVEEMGLPDAEDVDFATENVASTTAGEGHEQAYLQEVISDRALQRAEIARRMAILDSLLMRDYRAKEVDDVTLLTALGDEMGVGSEDLAGVPSIEAFVAKVEAGCEVVLDGSIDAPAACEFASLGIGEQARATEDAGARAFIGARLQEEHDAVASVVARVDTPSSVRRVTCDSDANSDYLGVVADKEPKRHNVSLDYYNDYDGLLDDILDDESVDAEDGDGIEVGEELAASPSDVIIEAPTCEFRELSEEVPLEILAERNCEFIAEDNEVIPINGPCEKVDKDEEDIAKADSDDQNDAVAVEEDERNDADKVQEDDQEATEISQAFVFDCDAAGPTYTSRWRGDNPRASHDFVEEVAQEIIDPMLAEAVHALESDIPLAPVPSAAWLTGAVTDLGCMRSLASQNNALDAAPTAAESQESTQADLGEAGLGWMKATASVGDLDALLNALETTESTLEDLGNTSLESITTDNDLEEFVASPETTESTLEDLGNTSLESITTDNDLEEFVASPETTESTLEDLGNTSLESITTDNDLEELVTSLETTESTPAGLEETPIERVQSTTTVDNLRDSVVTSREANEPMPFNPATSLDCVESTPSVHGIDKLRTSLKMSESLFTLDVGSVQPPGTESPKSLTSLAASSQADLAADSAATSLIELTHKASLVDLLPTPSVVGLAASSSESIDEATASASASTEEGVAVASMAAASGSAEWPDQGKEQHRAARINNKRNKKRNKRGGKK